MWKPQVSRLRQMRRRQISKLELIISLQQREYKQINFWFKHLKTHSKEMIKLIKQWIVSSIRQSLSEESWDQIKEANQANISKKRVPKFFEFWENVAAATRPYTQFAYSLLYFLLLLLFIVIYPLVYITLFYVVDSFALCI